MRKILTILLSVALTLSICSGLIGCSNEQFEYTYAPEELYAVAVDNYGNEYKIDISREKGESQKTIEYDIEYFSRFDDVPVEIGLKGLYEKTAHLFPRSFIILNLMTHKALLWMPLEQK